MKILNVATGMVQHPHPMFDNWSDQIEWVVNRHLPKVGSFTGVDSNGRAFCGRVAHDQSKPSAVIQLTAGLVCHPATKELK